MLLLVVIVFTTYYEKIITISTSIIWKMKRFLKRFSSKLVVKIEKALEKYST